MFKDESPEARLATSWEGNAYAWTHVIREEKVESRRLTTNAAILDAVRRWSPKSVVDVGCGEGWLCRALRKGGIATVGIDGAAALIAIAREADPEGDYRAMAYHEIAPGRIPPSDLAVCNFSMLDDRLHAFFAAMHALVHPDGRLVVQTVHPLNFEPYAAGWQEERFEGFGLPFPSVMPWYAHPLSAWVNEAVAAGWHLLALQEPRHPATGRVLSALFTYARAQ